MVKMAEFTGHTSRVLHLARVRSFPSAADGCHCCLLPIGSCQCKLQIVGLLLCCKPNLLQKNRCSLLDHLVDSQPLHLHLHSNMLSRMCHSVLPHPNFHECILCRAQTVPLSALRQQMRPCASGTALGAYPSSCQCQVLIVGSSCQHQDQVSTGKSVFLASSQVACLHGHVQVFKIPFYCCDACSSSCFNLQWLTASLVV